MLTEHAAKELGNALRFFRHAQNNSLRDVARDAQLSIGYIANLERGDKLNASEEVFEKLARGYHVKQEVVDDLLLQARIMSALERRGLGADDRAFIWTGIRQRLSERGMVPRTDIAAEAAALMR